MKTLTANVPDYLARLANEAAEKEKVSVDQIIALALASQIGAWRVRDDIATRAARGDLGDFDRVLEKALDLPPLAGDELPPGYASPV